MRKDTWKLLLWVLGLSALFAILVWFTGQVTSTEFLDSANAIHAIGVLVAVCLGGVFAYQRLQMFRTFEPHLTVSHSIHHRPIGDSYTHIDVTVTLLNGSRVQVELREGFFLLQQIAPEADEHIEDLYAQMFVEREYEEIRWTTLERIERHWNPGELVVEPGESHPESCEFIVSKDVESVMIYTYFYDQRFAQDSDYERGWLVSTVYDIGD